MALRKIQKYPSPCLTKVARAVEKFDENLAVLLDDMAETLYEAEGAGLAAPQVGVNKRVCVIDCGDGLIELINPKVIETSGEQGGMEGCLSVPGERGYVVRPNYVKVRAFNRAGKLMEYTGEGLFARAVMHETEHLDGLLYTRLIIETPKDYKEPESEE
ncbi:MAG: peptide deformylase [Clostridia bacterium]